MSLVSQQSMLNKKKKNFFIQYQKNIINLILFKKKIEFKIDTIKNYFFYYLKIIKIKIIKKKIFYFKFVKNLVKIIKIIIKN